MTRCHLCCFGASSGGSALFPFCEDYPPVQLPWNLTGGRLFPQRNPLAVHLDRKVPSFRDALCPLPWWKEDVQPRSGAKKRSGYPQVLAAPLPSEAVASLFLWLCLAICGSYSDPKIQELVLAWGDLTWPTPKSPPGHRPHQRLGPPSPETGKRTNTGQAATHPPMLLSDWISWMSSMFTPELFRYCRYSSKPQSSLQTPKR